METCPNCTKSSGSSHSLSLAIRNAIGFARTRNRKTVSLERRKLQTVTAGFSPSSLDLSSIELERRKNRPFLNNARNQMR